jgi:hypothetical protein
MQARSGVKRGYMDYDYDRPRRLCNIASARLTRHLPR